nr:MAG TPA: hypothetical protein [Caudoviricetes sp.]
MKRSCKRSEIDLSRFVLLRFLFLPERRNAWLSIR